MRKIIIMGECALDLIYRDSVPEKSYPGGRLLNAAALLGKENYHVTYVGECARDRVGDLIVDFLEEHNVITKSIDRYADGVTPLNIFFLPDKSHPDGSVVAYRRFPEEKFDVVWPRIDPDDIVVFGTSFAFNSRVRPQLQELINYAHTRRALIIYLPGFLASEAPRITRIMPAILENLELSDLVVSRSSDLQTIYNERDAEKCYHRNINFYCVPFINVDSEKGEVNYYHNSVIRTLPVGGRAASLSWNSSSLAGIISAIMSHDITREDLLSGRQDVIDNIIRGAVGK